MYSIGDIVTRNSKLPHISKFKGMCGTIVEVYPSYYFIDHCARYKVKWDRKSGKWSAGYVTFNPNIGQQHSTLQEKFLTLVLPHYQNSKTPNEEQTVSDKIWH